MGSTVISLPDHPIRPRSTFLRIVLYELHGTTFLRIIRVVEGLATGKDAPLEVREGGIDESNSPLIAYEVWLSEFGNKSFITQAGLLQT